MAIYRDRALCLRRYPYGESSLVAHVLSHAHGRVHVLAKGAYRTTSRYFAVLDLFDELDLEWSLSANVAAAGGLATLRAGSVVTRRRTIPSDAGRFRAGATALELADIAARHGAVDPRLFELVTQFLDRLDDARTRPDLELAAFELRFLGHLGLAPALELCAACGGKAAAVVKRPEPRAAFSAGAGGRLCRRCAEEARAAGRRVGTLPVRVLDDGRALVTAADATISDELDQARVDRVRDFVGRFLDYHLEARPLSHRSFLSTPNRNAPVR